MTAFDWYDFYRLEWASACMNKKMNEWMKDLSMDERNELQSDQVRQVKGQCRPSKFANWSAKSCSFNFERTSWPQYFRGKNVSCCRCINKNVWPFQKCGKWPIKYTFERSAFMLMFSSFKRMNMNGWLADTNVQMDPWMCEKISKQKNEWRDW